MIGEFDGFGDIGGAAEGGDGAEGFVVEDEHTEADLGEDGQGVEEADGSGAFAADDEAGDGGDGIIDLALEFSEEVEAGEGAHHGVGVHGVAEFLLGHGGGEVIDEAGEDGGFDDEAFGGDAALTGVGAAGFGGGGGGEIDIGVLEDDEGVGAAEFEDGFFKGGAGDGGDGGAGAFAGGGGDGGDAGIGAEFLGFGVIVDADGDEDAGEGGFAEGASRASAQAGTLGACLRMTTLPAAGAAAAKRMTCQTGKFQGMMARMGPRGSKRPWPRPPPVAREGFEGFGGDLCEVVGGGGGLGDFGFAGSGVCPFRRP